MKTDLTVIPAKAVGDRRKSWKLIYFLSKEVDSRCAATMAACKKETGCFYCACLCYRYGRNDDVLYIS